MAEFSAREDERGDWFSSREGNLEIFGHRASRLENELTVYWRGRTHARDLDEFFAASFPKSQVIPAVSALLFTETDRIRLDRLANSSELRAKLPDNPRFLRLEFLTRGHGDGAYEAEFIVWSRLDLDHIPKGQPAPDDIGVFLSTSHMGEITDRLAKFIKQTHIYNPPENAIKGCLQDLATHVGGGSADLPHNR